MGIMYRDIRLDNIVVCQDGYLKLIDFGLCKKLGRGQVTHEVCGTQEYLSPENILSKGYGHSADWWGLGIIIYELLISVTPFWSPDENMITKKILKGKVCFPDKKKYLIEYSDEIMDLI